MFAMNKMYNQIMFEVYFDYYWRFHRHPCINICCYYIWLFKCLKHKHYVVESIEQLIFMTRFVQVCLWLSASQRQESRFEYSSL